jgi:NitT/TauT family transport system substrate-binding protein
VIAMTKLTVWEPFRSIFYAPQWVTIHGGHFAAEGLEVEVKTAGGGVTTTGVLLDGGAPIALGGIMRSLDVADRGGAFLPHFAEVNSRNGFFLLGRSPRFAWKDLVGKTVLSFAEAPTPWQCMLTVLRREGVDPASVRIERTLPADRAMAAFRSGSGDFLETGQPFTEALLSAGAAHLAASMGEATGPVPFSSYMTTTAFLREGRDTLVRFTRALAHAQRWMARAAPEEISAVIAPAFPDVDPELRRRAVARYKAQGTWAPHPVLSRSGYEYLEQILLDGGFIRGRHRYEDLVDESVARHVVNTLGR